MLTKDLPDNTQFAIMRTDYYDGVPCPRMNQPDWSWGGANQSRVYPATVPGYRTENCNSQVTRKRWPKHLVEFYKRLNLHALDHAFFMTNGNINKGENNQIPPPYDLDSVEEMPQFEVLSYVGNTHVVKEVIENKAVRLDTLDFESTGLEQHNYKTSVYVSKFSAIRDDGLLFNLSMPDREPADNYMPLVSYDEFWIPNERVELYPKLPRTVQVRTTLNVRAEPSIAGELLSLLQYGDEVTITRYHPEMGNVWGQLGEGFWIGLRYQPSKGQQHYYHTTSWTLETPLPPRPMGELAGIEPEQEKYIKLSDALDALEGLRL